MSGLILMGFLSLWAGVAIVIARLFTFKLKPSPYRPLIKILASMAIFVLPLTDELIAWPRLHAMCESAGKYQYAPDMNEKKAFGREVYSVSQHEYWMLFPTVQKLAMQQELDELRQKKLGSVLIDKVITNYLDSETEEVVLFRYFVAPLSSSFSFPDASGGRNTWLLKKCGYANRLEYEKDKAFFTETLKLRINGVRVNFR